MTNHISRRQFLRGDFRNRRTPLRPPWALREDLFLDQCTRCNECMVVCPQNIISSDDGGFPQISFSAGECTFCGACVARCHAGALAGAGRQTAWNLKAMVSRECLALRGVHCQVCREHCGASTVHFQPHPGRLASPVIDSLACTGCGACVGPCPAGAIHIRRPDSTAADAVTNIHQEAVCT